MKSLTRTLLTSVLALATIPAFSQPQATTPAHTFTIQGDHFALNGKSFKILSGEMHYARIPRQYWHARLKMARAMGLNTVATYVFWNVHEPTPGQFDFTGNNDLVAFIKAAQEEGLYVILRAGPYSCAEWDFGGFPAWLLKDPRMSTVLRSNDPAFMVPAERWINRLGKEVADLQIGRGGPIIITQVENEYGGYKAAPDPTHAYMTHMRDIFLNAGFTGSLLDTVDGYKELTGGGIPGVFTGVNFGIDKHQIGMDTVASFQPGKPIFVSEYWSGWFDFWGEPHQTRPLQSQLDDVDYILHRGAGINLYMFHGGTDFGFMSGANFNEGNYFPETTSYDYDAPLDEAGHPTPKYFDFRKIFAKYATCAAGTGEICLPPVPDPPPVITIPQVILAESTSLWDNLPTPISSDTPKPMEQFDQAYGYILYRHQLPAAVSGDLVPRILVIDELHDYAQIYLDGKLAGTLDRRNKQFTLAISTSGPARLDILVENSGRINFSQAMRGESKGITKSVTLAGVPLTNWQVFPLPMPPLPTNFTSTNTTSSPTFRRGHFTLTNTGDTFLDVRSLGKGALWINGHAIGRFWNIGPQQTLFVPGPWLREGDNEVIVFDLFPSNAGPAVAGLATPILDAPIYPDLHFALHIFAALLLCLLILLFLWHRTRTRSNPQT